MRMEIDTQTNCWNWTGSTNEGGYGQLSVDGRRYPAHRLAYSFFVGPIPNGMVIDHLCENPRCCNPEHLEPVTHATNLLRSGNVVTTANARKTHCRRGHPFDAANTYVTPTGNRQCRACNALRGRANYKIAVEKQKGL